MRTGKPRRQKGAVLVIVVVILVVLLGMVALAVDISRLYVARQFLVNSCDAAALAGGMELPNQTKAIAEASECANANAMTTYQISFPTDGLSAGASKIRVDGQLNVQYAFAGIFGLQSGAVSAYAVVLRSGSVGWVSQNVVPWGIPYYDAFGNPYNFDNGTLYTLKTGSQQEISDGSPAKVGGNFYPLALERSLGDGSSGGNVYNHEIKYGFDGMVRVGDVVETEPGNMVGPTRQAVATDADSLFQRALAAPWTDDTRYNYDYGNPRIVVTPIISPLGNGRMEVQILGFAAFWVDSIKGQEVKGYFISYTIPEAGGTGTNYGVSTFQMVE